MALIRGSATRSASLPIAATCPTAASARCSKNPWARTERRSSTGRGNAGCSTTRRAPGISTSPSACRTTTSTARALPLRRTHGRSPSRVSRSLIEKLTDGRYDRFEYSAAQALVGGQGGGDRRRGARDPAEHRAGGRLRDDECARAWPFTWTRRLRSAQGLQEWEEKRGRSRTTRSASRCSTACRRSGRRGCGGLFYGLAGRSRWLTTAAHAHRAPHPDGNYFLVPTQPFPRCRRSRPRGP